MAETPLPDFVNWPSFPFTGDLRVKPLLPRASKEPPRQGENEGSCHACAAPDEAYIWVSERWRVRAMERPTGLPMVLILESRSHLDLGDLPNLLAAELGVMTVRLERAIRSLEGVARVHVNRWGDGSAHLHLWFLARPFGYLQLRGSFLSLWDDILPPIPEETWRENLALIAAWLAEFGGRPLAEPPRIDWQAPASVAAVQAAQSGVPVAEEIAQAEPAAPSAPDQPEAPARAAGTLVGEAPADDQAPDTAATQQTPAQQTPTPTQSAPTQQTSAQQTPVTPAAQQAPNGHPGTAPAQRPAEPAGAVQGQQTGQAAQAQQTGEAGPAQRGPAAPPQAGGPAAQGQQAPQGQVAGQAGQGQPAGQGAASPQAGTNGGAPNGAAQATAGPVAGAPNAAAPQPGSATSAGSAQQAGVARQPGAAPTQAT